MTCSIDGCPRAAECRGWCGMHYQRWKTHGDPLKTLLPSIEERFWSKVDKDSPISEHAPDGLPCWLWTAQINANGYGSFWANGRNNFAHRFAYELLVGPIPKGLTLDHLCRVRACVRPSHGEPVTQAENVRRGASPTAEISRSGACHQGHPFTESDTFVTPQGWRVCRICRRERQRAAYRGRRSAPARREAA